MTVSGLVVTLADDDDARARALAALACDPRVTCGEPQGLRLPVVTETTSLNEAEELFDALKVLQGVSFVDVVSIDFEAEVS
ncbi:MAG: hypothetical protein ACXWUG_18415 [Polyangiales bacterium]